MTTGSVEILDWGSPDGSLTESATGRRALSRRSPRQSLRLPLSFITPALKLGFRNSQSLARQQFSPTKRLHSYCEDPLQRNSSSSGAASAIEDDFGSFLDRCSMKISVKTLKGNHFDLQVAEDELVRALASPPWLSASLFGRCSVRCCS